MILVGREQGKSFFYPVYLYKQKRSCIFVVVFIHARMTLLIVFLIGAMSISFLCSILESGLMSTPLSYITMREDEGYRPATLFKSYKQDNARAIAAILSLNTIANTIGAAGVGYQTTEAFGNEWFGAVSAVTTILILVFFYK